MIWAASKHTKNYICPRPACRTTWNSTMTGSWSKLQTPQGALSAFSHQHWSVTLFKQLLSPNSQLCGLEEKNNNSDGSRGKVNLPSRGTALERATVPVWAATPRKARGGLGLCERGGETSGKKVGLGREGKQPWTGTSFLPFYLSHELQQKCLMIKLSIIIFLYKGFLKELQPDRNFKLYYWMLLNSNLLVCLLPKGLLVPHHKIAIYILHN